VTRLGRRVVQLSSVLTLSRSCRRETMSSLRKTFFRFRRNHRKAGARGQPIHGAE
jgi:hypothetical protein